jgi:hypothetical protein
LYGKLNGTKVTYKIIDKKDESGKALGSRVEVVVPLSKNLN